MKRYLFFLITLLCLSACQKERLLRNPNLGEARFSYSLNTNLPLYNVLKSDFSTVFVPYGGIKGFFVTHTTGNTYYAWEAACPNHSVNTCERLTCATKVSESARFEPCNDPNKHSFIFVQCSCDHTVYSLVNGGVISTDKREGVYPLLNYAVSVAGNIITISN